MSNKLEENVLNLLKEIGYTGPLVDKNEFSEAIEGGPKSIKFSCLVNFLCNELRLLSNIDECVNPMTTTEDSITFILEISSFLKESGCPYNSLTHGHASDRLSTAEERLLLLEYLISEIIAARILYENKPEKKLELKLNETPQAADLRKILQTLGFSKPPPNVTVQTLMQKLTQSVKNLVEKAGAELVGNSLFNGVLSEKQWEKLNEVQRELHEDYNIRRDTLLKRLDCTIQSFQWSDKTKGKEDLFETVYEKKRKILKSEPMVDISDLLAARDDLAIIEKTSSANVRKNTQSAVSKVIIGKVPDRGGRPSEQAPPPPEMPSWQQRSAGPQTGGTRGGRGGGRGNKQQSSGNFNQTGRSFDSAGNFGGNSNYSQGKSNYNRGGRSNYNRSDERGERGNDYNRGESNYSQAGSGYNRSGSDYNQSGSSYNRSGGDYSQTGSGYSRSGGDYSQTGSGYNRSGNDYNQAYDSAGSYYNQGSGSYTQGGRNYSNYNEPKRQKTLEQFQQNRSNYADQYVQESQQNQQYRPRGRGQSNYNRGGYR